MGNEIICFPIGDCMEKENLQNRQLFIIDGQGIGTLLYVISIGIALVVIWNQRKKALNQEEILTEQESKILTLGSRILIVLLVLWFLFLDWKSYELAADSGQDTSSLKIQIFASFLDVVTAFLTLYVVFTDFKNTNFSTVQTQSQIDSEIENPEN